MKRFYLRKKDESLISPRVKTISNMPSKSLESFKGASNKNDLLARDYNFHIVKKKWTENGLMNKHTLIP